MAYRTRHTDDPAIEDTLVRLWSANLQMRGNPHDKYRWYYRENPLGPAVAFLLDHVGEGREETVGSCGVGRRRVFVDGQALTAALFADFTVDKPHRTLMPAMTLQRALCTYAVDNCDFAYAFPNDAAVGIFNRIGLQTVGRARRYVKVVRTAPYMLARLRWKRAAGLAGAVVDPALRLRDRMRSPLPRDCRPAWTAQVDDRFDGLFERVRPHRPIIGERNATFLRWRFTERAGVPARIATLSEVNSGELRAYAVVVEKRPGEALVADFLGETPEALSGILAWIGPHLAAQGYATAVAYFLGSSEVHGSLVRAGFEPRNEAKFVIAGSRDGAPVRTGRLARTEDWYLTEADRDN
jgi:hypothetical protein